jgi:hypothetical protein
MSLPLLPVADAALSSRCLAAALADGLDPLEVECLGETLQMEAAAAVARTLSYFPKPTRRALVVANLGKSLANFNIDMSRLSALVRGHGTDPHTLATATDLLLAGGSLASVVSSSSSSDEEAEDSVPVALECVEVVRSPSVRAQSRSPSADFAGNTPSPSAEPAELPQLSQEEATASMLRAWPRPSTAPIADAAIPTGAGLSVAAQLTFRAVQLAMARPPPPPIPTKARPPSAPALAKHLPTKAAHLAPNPKPTLTPSVRFLALPKEAFRVNVGDICKGRGKGARAPAVPPVIQVIAPIVRPTARPRPSCNSRALARPTARPKS